MQRVRKRSLTLGKEKSLFPKDRVVYLLTEDLLMGIPGGLTAAVQTADTREMSDPSQLDFDMLSIRGNQIRYKMQARTIDHEKLKQSCCQK